MVDFNIGHNLRLNLGRVNSGSGSGSAQQAQEEIVVKPQSTKTRKASVSYAAKAPQMASGGGEVLKTITVGGKTVEVLLKPTDLPTMFSLAFRCEGKEYPHPNLTTVTKTMIQNMSDPALIIHAQEAGIGSDGVGGGSTPTGMPTSLTSYNWTKQERKEGNTWYCKVTLTPKGGDVNDTIAIEISGASALSGFSLEFEIERQLMNKNFTKTQGDNNATMLNHIKDILQRVKNAAGDSTKKVDNVLSNNGQSIKVEYDTANGGYHLGSSDVLSYEEALKKIREFMGV